MPGPADKLLACARLNLRVLSLALTGRWLGEREVAASYDGAAEGYDESWLKHLRSVTDELLFHLPRPDSGDLLELGCGTGYATERLSAANPRLPIAAVDVSARMLERARARLSGREAAFVQDDMLRFLRSRPADSASLVFSAWSMGYSTPFSVMVESARVLKPGGTFAFVVNLADTMEPVFTAFRRCMARHPGLVRLAAWPRFPKSGSDLAGSLQAVRLEPVWSVEGRKEIPRPEGPLLPWLLKTGVLAGFDRMLPLREAGPAAEAFESFLAEDPRPLRHHYAAAVARKR